MRAFLSHHPCTLLPGLPPQPWRPPRFPALSSRLRVSCATKYRPWDSDPESFRSEKFNSGFSGVEAEDDIDEDEDLGFAFGSRGKRRRRWWSDERSSAIDDTPFGILNEVVESIWILKVFKSYGWALPPIIASLLLTTGPKAFLMALALPLGQSLISLAFEKLRGGAGARQTRKPRTRKRGPAGPSKAGRKEEEEGEKREEAGKGKMGYQSWADSNNDDANKNTRNASDFGGWDDLDRVRSSRKSSSGTRGRNPKTAMEEDGKLSRKGRKSETPLLLRLLIAVFPFLGSWTKIL